MQDRVAVFMCNLKPAKMRGILSEGMIMCASSPDKVEILVPPPGSEIGDRVICKDFPGKDKKLYVVQNIHVKGENAGCQHFCPISFLSKTYLMV